MDARLQGSAFNLFLAHLKLTLMRRYCMHRLYFLCLSVHRFAIIFCEKAGLPCAINSEEGWGWYLHDVTRFCIVYYAQQDWLNMISFLHLTVGFLPLVPIVLAISFTRGESIVGLKSTTTDAYTRVDQTLNGLFYYYWRHDPMNKHTQFFFSCGQIGRGGTSNDGTCSCNNAKICLYCYRWWDAVALESVATHGIYTNTKNHSQIADIIFAYAPYNAGWNATATCTFIDDFSWYGIAYLRVYEWIKVRPNRFYLVRGLG